MSFTHEQLVDHSTWIIYHELNKKPKFRVFLDACKVGDRRAEEPLYFSYPDDNTLSLSFTQSHTGVVHIS